MVNRVLLGIGIFLIAWTAFMYYDTYFVNLQFEYSSCSGYYADIILGNKQPDKFNAKNIFLEEALERCPPIVYGYHYGWYNAVIGVILVGVSFLFRKKKNE